jgi:hypothetical protein
MSLFVAAFLILPIAVLVARESGKLKLSLWSIFFICIAVGWLLVYLAVEQYSASLDEVVRKTPNPPKEFLDEWQNDGAKQVLGLYFGWAYAAVYFLICLSVVRMMRVRRRK